jgi:Uma2 family endonuclease
LSAQGCEALDGGARKVDAFTMSTPQKVLFTVEDYTSLPETGPRYQLVEGDLIVAPAPNRYHQQISGNLEFLLRAYLKEHPIGKIYDAPFDVYLDDVNVFQPDILFVSKERHGILTDRGAEGAPDLVVEILSPSSARLDLDRKKKVYARHGVTEFWAISPETRQVQIYRLQEQVERPVAIHERIDTFESVLFPGLKIDAGEVFAE